MTILNVSIDEYCLFYEYLQGNDFNGLSYYNIIEDSFDINHDVYHIWNDELRETLAFSLAFTPYHYQIINETLTTEEQFGLPIQVSATSLEVMHKQKVRPIDIAFFSLEVLHGVDIFWEELSSGLHSTEYTQGAPYHFFGLIDYLSLDMNVLIGKVNFSQSLDRLNMRHTITQSYDFNNIIREQFFIYDWLTLVWGVNASSEIELTPLSEQALGFTVYDYLKYHDESISSWTGEQTLSDSFFTYDKAKDIKGYTQLLAESIELTSILSVPYFSELISSLEATDDLELTNLITTEILQEALIIQTVLTIVLKLLFDVTDPLEAIDEFTLSSAVQDYLLTLEDSLDLSVTSMANFITFRVISDAITGTDSGLLNFVLYPDINESLDTSEEIN